MGAGLPRPLSRLIPSADRPVMSAIESSMNRQVLKIILFALPKVLNHTASRVPAFRERLRQHDVVAWIGLQDGSIGRIVEIRSGRFRSRLGAAAQAEVTMVFKDVATALKFLLPNRNQGEIIHAAKNFKVVTTGPDELVAWFTQTLNKSDRWPAHGDAHARRQPPLHNLYQRRSPICGRSGRRNRRFDRTKEHRSASIMHLPGRSLADTVILPSGGEIITSRTQKF